MDAPIVQMLPVIDNESKLETASVISDSELMKDTRGRKARDPKHVEELEVVAKKFNMEKAKHRKAIKQLYVEHETEKKAVALKFAQKANPALVEEKIESEKDIKQKAKQLEKELAQLKKNLVKTSKKKTKKTVQTSL